MATSLISTKLPLPAASPMSEVGVERTQGGHAVMAASDPNSDINGAIVL